MTSHRRSKIIIFRLRDVITSGLKPRLWSTKKGPPIRGLNSGHKESEEPRAKKNTRSRISVIVSIEGCKQRRCYEINNCNIPGGHNHRSVVASYRGCRPSLILFQVLPTTSHIGDRNVGEEAPKVNIRNHRYGRLHVTKEKYPHRGVERPYHPRTKHLVIAPSHMKKKGLKWIIIPYL